MHQRQALDLQLHDSLLAPSGRDNDAAGGVARIRKIDGKILYKVWIYASGNDLPFVDFIEYTLHETFNPRTHRIARTPANPECALQIWTWGLFDVQALIVDKQGGQYRTVYPLGYDRMFNKVRFEQD